MGSRPAHIYRIYGSKYTPLCSTSGSPTYEICRQVLISTPNFQEHRIGESKLSCEYDFYEQRHASDCNIGRFILNNDLTYFNYIVLQHMRSSKKCLFGQQSRSRGRDATNWNMHFTCLHKISHYTTPLHYAAILGRDKLVYALLHELNASPNIVTQDFDNNGILTVLSATIYLDYFPPGYEKGEFLSKVCPKYWVGVKLCNGVQDNWVTYDKNRTLKILLDFGANPHEKSFHAGRYENPIEACRRMKKLEWFNILCTPRPLRSQIRMLLLKNTCYDFFYDKYSSIGKLMLKEKYIQEIQLPEIMIKYLLSEIYDD